MRLWTNFGFSKKSFEKVSHSLTDFFFFSCETKGNLSSRVAFEAQGHCQSKLVTFQKTGLWLAELEERCRLMSVAGKLYPQAPGVRMRMLIANPKCLPCARHFATLLSGTQWVPSTAPFTHPYGQALVPWMESVHPPDRPRSVLFVLSIHTCLAGRKGHRASSVPGPLLALPWLGMIPLLLSLES